MTMTWLQGVIFIILAMLPYTLSAKIREERSLAFSPFGARLNPATSPSTVNTRDLPIGMQWLEVHLEMPVIFLTIAFLGTMAPRILVQIYTNILNNLLDKWASIPPRNQLVIEAGSLRWEFGCTMTPVPWQFIEEYLKSRLDAVNRGFAPAFAKQYWILRSDNKRKCYAGLRIARENITTISPQRDL